MSISRRTALATGAAAITTAAITAPLALKAALAGDDSHLAALHAEWLVAEGAQIEARDVADRALFAAWRTAGPCPSDDMSGYSNGKELEAAMVPWRAAREAAVEKSDATELDCRADAAQDVANNAFDALMAAPAQTLRGVLFKFRGYYCDSEITDIMAGDDPSDLPGEVIAAIYRDIERLSGGLPS